MFEQHDQPGAIAQGERESVLRRCPAELSVRMGARESRERDRTRLRASLGTKSEPLRGNENLSSGQNVTPVSSPDTHHYVLPGREPVMRRKFKNQMRRKLAPLATLLVAACTAEGVAPPTNQEALALAESLSRLCPVSAPNDASARGQCADSLTDLTQLKDHLADPFLWGAQPSGVPVERVMEQASFAQYTSRVWRRMYLSTFMFDASGAKVEAAGDYTVLRVPVQFRNMLDEGEYPYPFWHSEKKWRSYETSIELLFFFEGDKIVAAVRSDVQDDSRSHVSRVFDGEWTWDNGAEPHNALYTALFSTTNPHVERLETAYRALEEGMQVQNCTACHDPANNAMVQRLAVLNYPNQALGGRHQIVTQLEGNMMPPGIGVADQVVRLDLIRLAREFSTAGDEALAFEGETVSE